MASAVLRDLALFATLFNIFAGSNTYGMAKTCREVTLLREAGHQGNLGYGCGKQ